jgi:glycosyltransferase involved in cell wall biosynthesis
MAESFLDARGSTASEQLCINLDVSESAVLKSRRDLPLLRHFESGRTWRDEVRCLSEARAVAGFDEGELELYSRSGVAAEYILRPCFASEKLTPIGRARHLLYLGDRTWKPNYLALARLLKLWGALVERCPGARLLVVGRGPLPPNSTQEGVRVLGYLDSVDQVWDDTRALVAPITIGGGVRIKILEAASRGVPVVASPAGLGSIGSYLPIRPVAGDADFIAECVKLLNDVPYAQHCSIELYEANKQWWSERRFEGDVRRWLDLA